MTQRPDLLWPRFFPRSRPGGSCLPFECPSSEFPGSSGSTDPGSGSSPAEVPDGVPLEEVGSEVDSEEDRSPWELVALWAVVSEVAGAASLAATVTGAGSGRSGVPRVPSGAGSMRCARPGVPVGGSAATSDEFEMAGSSPIATTLGPG